MIIIHDVTNDLVYGPSTPAGSLSYKHPLELVKVLAVLPTNELLQPGQVNSHI